MSSDNGKIKGTIGLKNIHINFSQKINFNSNINGKQNNFRQNAENIKPQTINTGFRPRTSFSNTIQTQNSTININTENQNSKPIDQFAKKENINQFRKVDFSTLKHNEYSTQKQTNNNEQTSQNSVNNKNDSITNFQNKQQFRKPNLNFQQIPSYLKVDTDKAKDNQKQEKKGFGAKTFKQTQTSFWNKSQDKKNGSVFAKKNDFKNNFFKKSSNIKIKLRDGNKKDNDKQTFKKTANTGGNIDKYSINGMLKTMSNNIELDTEIDDVLGNVISVKLSGINSANSLQKERKIRTSTGNNVPKVNFNQQITRDIKIYNNKISIANLADQMAITAKELVKILQNEGIEVGETETNAFGDIEIDGDTAELIANSYGHKITRLSDDDAENSFISAMQSSRTNVKPRAPIVTIMGHVDHGKTTLLDTIRKASVASREAGGITQHIGAYRTKVGDKWITFLDTPGHAAFTQMRARGAKVTDIVVIVVAADDGIMPQTEEAINHAKTAGVPIIVAINKIDKPDANIERTKQMLFQYGLVPDDLGGDVMVIPISAKEGKNIDKLLEAILLQAEMLELTAAYDGIPDGFIIEAKMDKKRGALATLIVKEGILSQGDFIIVGEQYGKIKGMFDENGKMLKTAEPSVPVEILGLNAVPNAGEIFYAVKNEKDVKEILLDRQEKAKLNAQNKKSGSSSADLLSRLKGEDKVKKIAFIIKADTKGSLEAIINTIEKFENNEVKLKVAHSAVGAVTENDVLLASTCNSFIMTFNVQKPDKKVSDMAEKNNINIRDYKIIYELFDDIKDILSGKLKPVITKTIQGRAEVKMIFEISKVGKIAGCLVKDGTIVRGANVAIVRNGDVILETKCNSIKHGKENVKEIQSGQECGIGIDDISNVKPGDILEFFTTKEEKGQFTT